MNHKALNHKAIKHRDISFCSLREDTNLSHSAVFIINDLSGVLMSHALNNRSVHIAYDLNYITFEEINAVLVNEGYHLDNSLLAKMKRSIAFYCEEAFRENSRREWALDEVHEQRKSELVYLRARKKSACECRDQRPEHWRKYL